MVRYFYSEWKGEKFPLQIHEAKNFIELVKITGILRAFISLLAFNVFCAIAITLYPFIIYRETINVLRGDSLSLHLMRHEFIHLIQQKNLGRKKFYMMYILEWLKNFFLKGRIRDAYYEISFEKEANIISKDSASFQFFINSCLS